MLINVVSDNTDAKQMYTENDMVTMLNIVIGNVYVEFGVFIFQQDIWIPMGTNVAPSLADLFLCSYESEVFQRSGAKHSLHQWRVVNK